MNAQIEEFVKKCRTCSQCKHAPRPKAAVQNHKDTQNIFEMVAIDIASMPTSVRRNGYFLLIVDNYSKLMTAIAMRDAKAETSSGETAFVTLAFLNSCNQTRAAM